jgi:hypothetical protein
VFTLHAYSFPERPISSEIGYDTPIDCVHHTEIYVCAPILEQKNPLMLRTMPLLGTNRSQHSILLPKLPYGKEGRVLKVVASECMNSGHFYSELLVSKHGPLYIFS